MRLGSNYIGDMAYSIFASLERNRCLKKLILSI